MKKYNIVVNGTAYAVEVSEEAAAAATAPITQQASAPAQPAPTQQAPAPAPEKAAAPSEGAQLVTSPMPGTIWEIKVTPGEVVSEGQTLIILEAMKMENEIAAPAAGTVDTIQVSKGASVNAGDLLVTLK